MWTRATATQGNAFHKAIKKYQEINSHNRTCQFVSKRHVYKFRILAHAQGNGVLEGQPDLC